MRTGREPVRGQASMPRILPGDSWQIRAGKLAEYIQHRWPRISVQQIEADPKGTMVQFQDQPRFDYTIKDPDAYQTHVQQVTGDLAQANSGVQIRSELKEREHFVVWGPQCDMGQQYWASLYGEHFGQKEVGKGGFLKAADPEVVKKVLKPGEFNDYYIKAVGKHVTIKLNGATTVDADFDNLPAPALPEEFSALARELAASVEMPFDPDLCIMNYYDMDGRMGLHQDKDEGPRSIEAGLPVVSLSLGDTARFLFGGLRRKDPVEALPLESGDAFIFGGPSRLRYHGVSRILPGTAPVELQMTGRFNLTLRQYDVREHADSSTRTSVPALD